MTREFLQISSPEDEFYLSISASGELIVVGDDGDVVQYSVIPATFAVFPQKGGDEHYHVDLTREKLVELRDFIEEVLASGRGK